MTRTVIPRVAKDTGLSEATVRSYLYFRKPSRMFLKNVQDLYGWELQDSTEIKEAWALPEITTRDTKSVIRFARETELALKKKNGYRAKYLHTRMTHKFYEAFITLGFLTECTLHADLSAVFTLGRDTSLSVVLTVDKGQRLTATTVDNASRGRRKKTYQLRDPDQVADLLGLAWGVDV